MDFWFTRNGIDLMLRKPKVGDAEEILTFAKALFNSTDQVLTTSEEFTVTPEQEKQWIEDSLQNPDKLILVITNEEEIVGLLDFAPKTKRKNAHTGEFGVSVRYDFQGMGIGSMLIESLLKWAKANRHIEKVFLNVMATNLRAIELYKKLGFQEEGRHIRAIKQLNGDYVDLIQMYILTAPAADKI